MSSLDFRYKGVGESLSDRHRRDGDECDKQTTRGNLRQTKEMGKVDGVKKSGDAETDSICDLYSDLERELYPYEVIRVVTSDGYVLLLERIPRRDSAKVVYLQHGILDSSMGWVSNGVVGSPAFAAFDQGLVSREHVDKNISSRKYWKYTINEHATKDMPAMINKIHEIKTAELNELSKPDSDEEVCDQPYKLCATSHSLGGAVMLMYVITSRINLVPHRLSRLILLSPAGFHDDSTIVFTILARVMLLLGPLISTVVPGLYIPTRFFRMLINKLARDFQNYPALGGLVQTLMSYVVGGDSSNWIGVLGLPHYNMYDMPGVSLYVALHLAQIMRSKKFIMFDYGSAAANIEAYGSPEPLDLGQRYNLIDIPVDLVAGRKDKVIKPAMVKRHYALMRKANVEVSYKEFEYAHLDFTFSHREELLAYVMSRLLLVDPPQKHQRTQATLRLRKPSGSQTKAEELVSSRLLQLDPSQSLLSWHLSVGSHLLIKALIVGIVPASPEGQVD
ncbi:hypothetical protein ZIOFF_015408 [Zingiber officinale]|uniref:Partial AB-hydrolase lipase domain-containing protein n=1 Tax=Zingiber officinale TaxID=94328 RepID=A0A8J5LME8_ZINOF|nr:hypothetical protein ZIOFF_015408 [Zingiber officinale]